MADYFDTYKRRLEASRPPFEKMVDEDIQKCEAFLVGDKNEEEGKALHLELITKYPSYITNFGESLYNYNKDYGFVSQEYFGGDALISNLTVIKSKLIAFKSFGYKNGNSKSRGGNINIENTLTATQTQTIAITFEEVKRQIEEMSALSDSETQETLDKIDELKVIAEAKESPKTKWQKVKPILAWIADKSVDVGIALLPLILKIGA